MRFLYTDGRNKDFVTLCQLLDSDLNILAGGEENRAQYNQHNKLDNIHDVIVAYNNDEPIACGSFKEIDNDTAEVKRVFVAKAHRGTGLSREIMNLLEKSAREKGYKKIILETGRHMSVAVNMYKNIGYSVVPNYGQYKDMVRSICFEKIL